MKSNGIVFFIENFFVILPTIIVIIIFLVVWAKHLDGPSISNTADQLKETVSQKLWRDISRMDITASKVGTIFVLIVGAIGTLVIFII